MGNAPVGLWSLNNDVAVAEGNAKVWTGTWNLGNSAPEQKQLKQWIPTKGYDLYFIGTQESTYGANHLNDDSDDEEYADNARQRASAIIVPEDIAEAVKKQLAQENDDADAEQVAVDSKFELAAQQKAINKRGSAVPLPAFIQKDIAKKALKEEKKKNLKQIQDSESDPWLQMVRAHFQAADTDFYHIASVRMGEIRGTLFCPTERRYLISNVLTTQRATGIGNILANKGGVGISLVYAGTRILFITAHCAAHQGKTYLARRNEDIKNILAAFTTNIEKVHPRFGLPCYFQHQVTFICGDLNYRLNIEGDEKTAPKAVHDRVCQSIKNSDLASLQKIDQLKGEQKAERVLTGWQEGTLSFRPTFKVYPGAELKQEAMFPNLAYMPKRSPAWCDRVLWYSQALDVKNIEYSSREAITTSDHKPVVATFNVGLSPRADRHRDGAGTVSLVVTNLKATIAPPDKTAHARVKLTVYSSVCDAKADTASTDGVQDNVHEWKQLPRMNVIANNPAALKHTSLYFKCQTSAGRVICQGMFPLKTYPWRQENSGQDFKVPLLLNAVAWGTLEGKIRFERKDCTLPKAQMMRLINWEPRDDVANLSTWNQRLETFFNKISTDGKLSRSVFVQKMPPLLFENTQVANEVKTQQGALVQALAGLLYANSQTAQYAEFKKIIDKRVLHGNPPTISAMNRLTKLIGLKEKVTFWSRTANFFNPINPFKKT